MLRLVVIFCAFVQVYCATSGKCANGDPHGTPGCGVNCGMTCSTYKSNDSITCPDVCYEDGCNCNSGYVQDESTGFCVLPNDCKSYPLTKTPAGSILGSWMKTRRGRSIEAYRGVRYAEAPIGKLRFQPPVLITKYSSTVNASVEGPACPQPALGRTGDFYTDEDCLRLNVYTPADRNSSRSLPVIVYLHAGAYVVGTGRSDVAGPLYLLDHDVVLVAINHRLGCLGYLSTGDKYAPGNNAFKDQTVALRWIKQNIASFGGDPNNVVLTGNSVGSFSIPLHIVSPMSKGLFHKAISLSGGPLSQIPIEPHQRYLAERQAKLLQCPSNSTEDMINCFQNKTADQIANTLFGMFEWGFEPTVLWNAVVEPDFGQERFLPEHPLELLKKGDFNYVPYIITQTQDEFLSKAFDLLRNTNLTQQFNDDYQRIAPIAFILPSRNSSTEPNKLKSFYLGGKPFTNTTALVNGLGNAYSDAIIGFGVHRLAQLMCRHSTKPVYYGLFAYVGQYSRYVDPNTKKPIGAVHRDDLTYLLSAPADLPIISLESNDNKVIETMTLFWYNFATQGTPTPPGSSTLWPVLTADSQQYLRISSNLTVEKNMFADRFKLWDELYPITY